jgi:hypothetical protein
MLPWQAVLESISCDAAEKRSKQGKRDAHAEIFGSSCWTACGCPESSIAT